MTTRCQTHTQRTERLRVSVPSLGKPRSDLPGKLGFMPTTSIATPRGWQSASSILPGDTILTPTGERQEVLDVQQNTLDPYELMDSPEDWPVLIPSYALGNLTELAVLPEQSFQIPKTVMGLQHLSDLGQATARDLVGLNGIRTVDPEDVQVAISLVFAEQTIISCAHGGLAVCSGVQHTRLSGWTSLLAA